MSAFVIDRGVPHVTLSVASETYAVAAASVAEIAALQPLTPLATMPPCVLGLMNLRGTVIPVIDLSEKLGFGMTAIGPRTCAMVVSTEVDGVPAPIGVIADEILDIVSLAPSDIGPPPAFGSPVDTGYLSGVTRLDGHYAMILNLTRILSPEELLATVRKPAPEKRRRRKDRGTA